MCVKLLIVEPPADQLKKRAARYPSEGRKTVNIVGRNHTQEHPSYPRVAVQGYNGPNEELIMEARCVSVENHNRDAPFFQLYNPRGNKTSQVSVDGATGIAEFSNLVVRRIKTTGTSASMDHRRRGVDRTAHSASENKTSFCLRFQACTKKDSHAICDPVYSNPISTEEITSLEIIKLSKDNAPMTGGTEIMLCCRKLRTRNIRVRFFCEEPAGCWEAYAQDVRNHEKVTLWFKTPVYTGMWKNCNKPVMARIQLCCPNDGKWGEPEFFTFLPKPEAQFDFSTTPNTPFSTNVDCLENNAIVITPPIPSSTGSSSQIPSRMADPRVINEVVIIPPADTSSSSSPFTNAGHLSPSNCNDHRPYSNSSPYSCASTSSTSNDTQLDFTSSPNHFTSDSWVNNEVAMILAGDTSSLSAFTDTGHLSPGNWSNYSPYSNSSPYSCTSTSPCPSDTQLDSPYSPDPWVNNEVVTIPPADTPSISSAFINDGHLSPSNWSNYGRYSNSSPYRCTSTSPCPSDTLVDFTWVNNEVATIPSVNTSLSSSSLTNAGYVSPPICNDHRRCSNFSTYSCASTSCTSNNPLVDFTSSPRQFSSDSWVNNEVVMTPPANTSGSSPLTNPGHLSPSNYNDHRGYSNSSPYSCTSTSPSPNHTQLDSPYSPDPWVNSGVVIIPPADTPSISSAFIGDGHLSPGNWNNRRRYSNSSAQSSTSTSFTSNNTLLDSPYSPTQLPSSNSPLENNDVGVTPLEMSLSELTFANADQFQNSIENEYRSTAVTPTSYDYEQTLNQPLSPPAFEQAPQSRSKPNPDHNLPQLMIQDDLDFNLADFSE